MGEGLALEMASMGPPRNSVRLLAEQKESFPAAGARPMPIEGFAMSAGSGVSPLSVPAGIVQTHTPTLELDEDMMNDVVVLAQMQRGERLDVQANAATAAAGLTTNREFCGITTLHHTRTSRRHFRSVVLAPRHRPCFSSPAVHNLPIVLPPSSFASSAPWVSRFFALNSRPPGTAFSRRCLQDREGLRRRLCPSPRGN